MRNEDVADALDLLADVLEFKGENPFKLRAYRKAARVLRDLQEDVSTLVAEGRLRDLPGIGEGIEKKVAQFVKTGKMDALEAAMEGVSPGIVEIMKIPGVGPRTAALAREKLNVQSVEELAEAARSGRLAELPGMGAKKAENILKGIEFMRRAKGRMPLGKVLPLVESLLDELRRHGVKKVVAAGSLRRMCETIGDIDILASGRSGEKIVRAFTGLPLVARVLASGDTKGSILTADGTQVDLRVVEPASYGAALQYFTGSKAHNIRLRSIARDRGLKLSEYGLFRDERRVAGRTEEEIYEVLGLPCIPPVLREDRGEIEAALEGKLPKLVELRDISGDLHVHTNWSDGHNSIEEMAAAARKRGYRYLVISDHTRALKIFGGLDASRLLEQIEEVKRVNARVRGIRVLTGTEVDIRADGTLDMADEVLAKLDFVTASVHSGFAQDRDTMTRRILAAIENPHVDSIGHLTGRLLGERDGYDVDVDAILRAAARTGTALELNAHPARLDINDQACRRAKELGVKVAINTDAHDVEQLDLMRFGVATAQRGWLERSDVLNARAEPPVGKGARPR